MQCNYRRKDIVFFSYKKVFFLLLKWRKKKDWNVEQQVIINSWKWCDHLMKSRRPVPSSSVNDTSVVLSALPLTIPTSLICKTPRINRRKRANRNERKRRRSTLAVSTPSTTKGAPLSPLADWCASAICLTVSGVVLDAPRICRSNHPTQAVTVRSGGHA